MAKAAVLTAMSVLLVGSLLQQHASARSWTVIFLHGATSQWLAIVIVLASLLTMADLGGGSFAVVLAVLIAAGYLMGAAGWLGTAIESAVRAEWGNP